MSGDRHGQAPVTEIVHSGAFRPLWWLCLGIIVVAALWGWPLLDGDSFQHRFFGVFWYSMIGLATAVWAVPAEQGCDGTTLERRWTLLGLLTLKRDTLPVSTFNEIRLEQEPNRIGADSIWVVFESGGDPRFVFAHFRASVEGVARAQALARQLSTVSQLPFAEQAPEAG
ncbi:hypothetical protein IGB42_03070 [Andreprevotia sp. IGB-42]|uniref:hypothetical protein n=1 Tax=Andreprevotia sp. IGB-42 TaxID=2497473 RepID=UPI00135A5567|nr:hypothetical protein [Andreprevotia sp. IGB-42]KAF0812402.1 hypothetical protein IGB42_03070 [Andreprevotia sp. IGB-42]